MLLKNMRVGGKAINTRTVNALAKKKIYTENDLVSFVPRIYRDYRAPSLCSEVKAGEYVALRGRLVDLKSQKAPGSKWYLKGKLIQADGTKVLLMWFMQVDFYAKQYTKYIDHDVVVCGKLEYKAPYGYSIGNPERLCSKLEFRPGMVPIYPNVKGVSEDMRAELTALAMRNVEEPLAYEVMHEYALPSYRETLSMLHHPRTPEDVEIGKDRLLFNDLLYFAITFKIGEDSEDSLTDIHFPSCQKAAGFIKSLPFTLTEDQLAVLNTVIYNANRGKRNNVLLQGDVGCGKTIVAAVLMIAAAENGYQSVLMAPREVLARQHYNEIAGYAEKLGIRAAYLHSGMKSKEKNEILKEIENGNIQFIIGTHSVLGPSVRYNRLGLVVTDEEHLFGVEQKTALEEKAADGVHSLSMSATPIPRTLASVMYGKKKDIMMIKTKPAGRKEIQTAIQVGHSNVFPFMEKEIRAGHQCYVVCPAITDNEDTDIVSIDSMLAEYNAYFSSKGIRIGVVNGKMEKEEVTETIRQFSANEIQILMSTTVIEVGVNVPNATVIVIEQADRFGLASLHQLRGRVGRSALQSYCILRSDDRTNERLLTMCKTTDGFKIAEADLKQRGSGNLIGLKQAGTDKYVEEMLEHPDIFKRASEVASFCYKHRYAERLVAIYEEHLSCLKGEN